MLLGAFLDLGVPAEVIVEALEALHTPGLTLSVQRVVKGGMAAIKAEVVEHEHEHDGDHHGHAHRPYREIRALLEKASLGAEVRRIAGEVFARLARVEGRLHGMAPDDVEFHEVGALDAIGDVVANAAAVAWLAPAGISVAPLALGGGQVKSAHGILPVPAPATVGLLAEAGLPGVRGGPQVELTTPTGAALLAAIATGTTCPPMVDVAAGHGAGTRDLADRPNVVRVTAGRPGAAAVAELEVLEANVDDMSPELWPDVLARLLAHGALDAWLTPIVMKKGRPAVQLSALVPAKLRAALAEIVLRETTTLGLRFHAVGRDVLERRIVTVATRHGAVEVKLGLRDGKVWNLAPEHASVQRVAEAAGVPAKQVHAEALAAALALHAG
jgi:uncharacterized protein (TIGR00299 family) protein